MATYIAEKIIEGKQDYAKTFSFTLYKQYQEEVDRILTEKGRADLIVKQGE